MLSNLFFGILFTTICLIVQCLVLFGALRILFVLEQKGHVRSTLKHTVVVLGCMLLSLFAGNLLQISIWAQLFMVLGEFDAFRDAFYVSIVSFSTLGYGDVVMGDEHRMLGGFEASNGVLMLGLTSAYLAIIVERLLRGAWKDLSFSSEQSDTASS